MEEQKIEISAYYVHTTKSRKLPQRSAYNHMEATLEAYFHHSKPLLQAPLQRPYVCDRHDV